ncbi:MAG: hypothetical protein COZ21_05745 [Bacteroidetes bacterium CG_4_10_14_3_um_filter_31_20]|nr:MAG: hypothetical protein COZ21_05745 [Bacteroidetes bacterium CG_4_10_14_3_um_filter_31_20]
MYITFHINASELDFNFLNGVKAMFKNKPISIIIEEEQDETEYLLQSDANRNMLLKSIKQAERGELIKVKIGKAKKK